MPANNGRKALPRILLASIHDVAPSFESEIDALVDRLSRDLDGLNLAMLVVPNYWGEAPLADSPGFQSRLRRWSEAGVEMFLHGWFHRDDQSHRFGLGAVKARHLTAGEGEFSALDYAEAQRRIGDGRNLLEDVLGRPIAGFVAPAWLYSQQSKDALRDSGILLAEDHMRVWRPADDKTLARGPVITWASRSPARIASSLAFAALARRALAYQRVVRLAVHPGDTRVPEICSSISRALKSLLRTRTPGRYSDLEKKVVPMA